MTIQRIGARLLAIAIAAAAIALTCATLTGCGGSPSSRWNLPAPELTEEGFSLQLKDNQKSSCAAAYYTIIKTWDDGTGFYPAMSNVPIAVSDSGQILAPADPEVLVAVGEDGETMLCGAEYKPEDDGAPRFVCDNLRLIASRYPFAGTDSISLAAKPNDASGELDISIDGVNKCAYPASGDAFDTMSRYRYLQMLWREGALQTRIGGGSLYPISEWDKTDFSTSAEVEWGSEAEFKLTPSSDYEDGGLFLQVVIEDPSGALHGSELAEIKPLAVEEETSLEMPTEKGALTFSMKEGVATLEKYEGEDEILDIPDNVEGLPVTTISPLSFSGNQYIHEVNLPDSIEEIGSQAFSSSQIRHFAIPKNLKRIDGSAFSGTAALQEFFQQDQNGITSVRDGVLYSADGTTLLAYPAAKGDSFVVPEGVITIGHAAFFNSSSLKHIEFPESLRVIGDCAFLNSFGLDHIDLPDALERIGASAFGGYVGGKTLQQNNISIEEGDSIFIGRNVSAIGEGAFDGLDLRFINVDSENPWYTSQDGFLLTKDNVVYQAPSILQDAIEIPDGTTGLAENSLSKFQGPKNADGTTGFVDIFLPASLREIEEDALPKRGEANDLDYTGRQAPASMFHAPKGSWAESYAQEQGIACDNISSARGLHYETTTVSLRKAELSFRLYDDHAVLVGINGKGVGHIQIPEEVNGLPVTAIGANDNDRPSGQVKTIIVPKSVERIEGNLLTSVSNVRKFEVDAQSEHFTVREGAIYNADGTVLVAYPPDRAESYDIPEGTVEIAEGAFRDAKVESVHFPEGVKVIGAEAFASCSKLAEIAFPTTLEYIGKGAFQSTNLHHIGLNEGLVTIAKNSFDCSPISGDGIDAIDIPDSVSEIGTNTFENQYGELCPVNSRTVKIGKGLSSIGESTFVGLDIDSFTVDSENEHFKAAGPFLLSKDGRILFRCAGAAGAELRVPDGVEEISAYAFQNVPALTDVSIPDSVRLIDYSAFDTPDQFDNKDPITLHCSGGSAAAHFAEARKLNWVED